MKLILIICLVSFDLNSQQLIDSFETNQQHTSYLGSQSVNPFTINQNQIPINTSIQPSLSLILKSNSGNTMIHKTILTNKNGGYREIEYNAVIEKDAIYFSYPFHEKIEAFMEIGLNSASRKGKYNPMNWIVQDTFIEKVHEALGKSDPFKRKEIGFDKFSYKSMDEEGNISKIEANIIFSIRFVIGANYYLMLFQNKNKIISINTTLSLKVPLKPFSMRQKAETSLGIGINKTKNIRGNKSLTSSFHGSAYFHKNSKNKGYVLSKRKITYKLSGLLGINMHSRKSDNTYSIFTTLTKTSSRLKAHDYTTQGNMLNQQALDAATGGNEYLEFGSNYSIHFKNNNVLKVELTFREDLNIKSINNTFWGRNSEDFGVFLGIQYIIH
ncbi:hypothetical protein [Aureibaculum luteum]|uniref:hypothetical protein n=1 Tax=Aureibaculum luteum TaxID=1548456 RepID=UPI0013001BF5|nr:hypothetical protein [Aureibaculum luteum]